MSIKIVNGAGAVIGTLRRLKLGAGVDLQPFMSEPTTYEVTAAGATHADLATHDAMGLATDAELATHAAAGDPHTGYRLESADHSHASSGLQGGQVAHSALSGVSATDHHAAAVAGPDANDTVDAAGAAGTAGTFARSQHGHRVNTDASVASTQAFGDAATAGTSGTIQRAGHKHAMPADPVPAHEAAGDPHTGYRLESADHSHASSGLQGGQVSHANLSGVTANQHHNQSHDHSASGDGQSLAPAGTFALSGAPTTITTTGSITAQAVTNGVLRWNGASSATLHGIAGGAEGRFILVENVTTGQLLTLAHDSATETTAGNRILVPDLANFQMRPGTAMLLAYDNTTTRWRVFGIGTSATPASNIGTASAGSAGVNASRVDHVHATGAGTPSTQAMGDAAITGSGPAAAMTDHKHAMPTLGYGLSGASSPAVGLSQTSAFLATAVSVSAATYADLTGASVSLTAGTWLVIGQVFGSAANLAFLMHAAITDGANAVVSEGSAFVPASGTASVHTWGSIPLMAIVTPGGTTTYKLRAARGLTTLTNTWTAQDGAGTNVTNNASTATDKGTGIFAIRIA